MCIILAVSFFLNRYLGSIEKGLKNSGLDVPAWIFQAFLDTAWVAIKTARIVHID